MSSFTESLETLNRLGITKRLRKISNVKNVYSTTSDKRVSVDYYKTHHESSSYNFDVNISVLEIDGNTALSVEEEANHLVNLLVNILGNNNYNSELTKQSDKHIISSISTSFTNFRMNYRGNTYRECLMTIMHTDFYSYKKCILLDSKSEICTDEIILARYGLLTSIQ